MHFVYVLYSKRFDKIYIGYSSNPEIRLSFHNSDSNTGWTKRYKPWKIIYTEQFQTLLEAYKREKQLKTSRGRNFIRDLITRKKVELL